MNHKLVPLMQREWLQHRFGWALLAGVPLALALALTAVGQIELDADAISRAGPALPVLLAAIAIAGTTAVMFCIAWASSLIIVSGMARRDHADRSIEFWLSLPASHSDSLAAPLLVHLILVPAAALLVGLAGGYALSLVLVTRVAGFDAWVGLPWGMTIAASLSWALRLLAGLPLATLWLAPLILMVVLLTAWFRRWGWVILTVGMGLGGWLLKRVFGHPMLQQVTTDLLRHAAHAMVNSIEGGAPVRTGGDAAAALTQVPAWALSDFGMALRDLASPLFVGAVLVAAACFALLLQWRRRGAGSAG